MKKYLESLEGLNLLGRIFSIKRQDSQPKEFFDNKQNYFIEKIYWRSIVSKNILFPASGEAHGLIQIKVPFPNNLGKG